MAGEEEAGSGEFGAGGEGVGSEGVTREERFTEQPHQLPPTLVKLGENERETAVNSDKALSPQKIAQRKEKKFKIFIW